MDPITATTAVITIATALKDVIQLAVAFKSSLDMIPFNIQSLKDDVNHIAILLSQLQTAAAPSDTANMGDETSHQIMELHTGLSSLHEQHVKLVQDFMDPQFRSWVWVPLSLYRARKRLRMWYKREETSGEIVRLRKLVEQMQMRFLLVEAVKARKHREMGEKVTALLLLDTSAGKEALLRRQYIRLISDQAQHEISRDSFLEWTRLVSLTLELYERDAHSVYRIFDRYEEYEEYEEPTFKDCGASHINTLVKPITMVEWLAFEPWVKILCLEIIDSRTDETQERSPLLLRYGGLEGSIFAFESVDEDFARVLRLLFQQKSSIYTSNGVREKVILKFSGENPGGEIPF